MPSPLIVVPVVVIVAAAAFWLVFFRKPDLSVYLYLAEPRIATEPDIMVLEVAGHGLPGDVAKRAFATLFKIYYRLKGVPKGMRKPLPRGRWRFDEPDADGMFGRVAIPLPETVTKLPMVEPPPDLTVQIARWEYGEVAEILHIGPYDREEPVVERLKSFIDTSGYEIAGDHEEVYLRGPGMFGSGNPGNYYTILRYRVRKKRAREAGGAATDGVVL